MLIHVLNYPDPCTELYGSINKIIWIRIPNYSDQVYCTQPKRTKTLFGIKDYLHYI